MAHMDELPDLDVIPARKQIRAERMTAPESSDTGCASPKTALNKLGKGKVAKITGGLGRTAAKKLPPARMTVKR